MNTSRLTRRNWLKLMVGSAACGLAACAPRAAAPAPVPEPEAVISAAAAPAEKAISDKAAAPAVSAPAAAAPVEPKPTVEAVVAPKSDLPEGPAAPVVDSAIWLNTPGKKPLAWDSLRGQVFMVEFWTIGCINCQHVIPSMISMYADYKDRGFTILGVHSPEFDYEKQLNNVRTSVKKWGIEYPVAIDNDFENWNRYRNRYWPARYLVDKRGVIRHTHIGEGGDEETRQWIETLLAE